MAILAILYVSFGIMGVQFFKGKMRSCNDKALANLTLCEGDFYDNITDSIIPRQVRYVFKKEINLIKKKNKTITNKPQLKRGKSEFMSFANNCTQLCIKWCFVSFF